jgi:hypothetical protein
VTRKVGEVAIAVLPVHKSNQASIELAELPNLERRRGDLSDINLNRPFLDDEYRVNPIRRSDCRIDRILELLGNSFRKARQSYQGDIMYWTAC